MLETGQYPEHIDDKQGQNRSCRKAYLRLGLDNVIELKTSTIAAVQKSPASFRGTDFLPQSGFFKTTHLLFHRYHLFTLSLQRV